MYTCFDRKVGRFWDSDFGWGNRGVIWNLNFSWKSATLFCFCFNNKLNFDNFEFHRVLTGSLMTNWNKIIKVSKYILNYFCASWPCLKQGDHLKLKLLMRISNPFCSSQPSLVHWLSSSIFPCSVVRSAMGTSDQISTFFNIYRHKALYWPSFT